MTALSDLLAVTAKALRPPPILRNSEWAAQNFRLSAETTAEHGRFRPWKFQRIMLDLIGDATVERVTIPKGARIGYSKCLVACIAADAANDPSPIILLVPTDDDARGMAVDEIDPAFRESPALHGLMKVGKFDGRNTLTQRALTGGGSLKILSARSPRNLRRHSAKKLYCDEVDAMEVTTEGDPIDLAEKRTQSYKPRKIVLGSTPTDEATSIVWERWLKSDQGVFQVECPHCREHFELLWEHISWPAGETKKAAATCPCCGSEIAHDRKREMVENGRRFVLKPGVEDHAGFRLNALVSLQPNASWGQLAREYEEAKAVGPSALQVFYNTVLGLPWSNALEHVSDSVLKARAEDFGIFFDPRRSQWVVNIPAQVLYITVGVDVQTDRLEITFLGWSETQRWSLGHEVIHGATNLQSTWEELDAMLSTRWRHPLGNEIGIEATAIDSGDGNRTQAVYDFCGPRTGRRIIPVKGRPGPHPTIEATKSRRVKRGGARLHLVAVDQVKTDILTSLSIEPFLPNGDPATGAFRFSDCLTPDWFRQLTSEHRVVEYPRGGGRPVVKFKRISGRQAEALDATAYAIAVRSICRFDFDRRRAELTKDAPVKKGGFLSSLKRMQGM